MKQETSRILVTGATGFIGGHMVSFLKDKGHYVIAAIRKPNLLTRPLYSKADKVIKLNLLNLKEVEQAFQNIDVVYHFAANMGGVGFFSAHNYEPFIDNMQMDLNIIKSAEKRKVKRVFYPSSACAYPIHIQSTEKVTPQLSEEMLIPANADQMYGWEKFTMILLAREAPLDIRVGILNTIFGEYQEWDGERAKFPPSIVRKVIEAKRNKTSITIWGNGKQTRTFLYIEDALEKIYEVMSKDNYWGEVNIASDHIVTVKQCADWVCQAAGIKPDYVFDKSKPSGVLARGIDNSKFYKHYVYRNKFSTEEGFRRLYEWMATKVRKDY